MCNANPESFEQFLHDAYGMSDEEFQRGLERHGAPVAARVTASETSAPVGTLPSRSPRPAPQAPPMPRVATG